MGQLKLVLEGEFTMKLLNALLLKMLGIMILINLSMGDEHYGPPEHHYEPPKEHHEVSEPHYGQPDPYHDSSHHEKDDHKCVDISTWSELKFKKVEKEHCKVEYEKITEKKQDKVCSDVTSIHCTVLPYTECEMKIKTEKHYSCEWFWN